MSANLGIRGLIWTENSRESEERDLIHPTLILYLFSSCYFYLFIEGF